MWLLHVDKLRLDNFPDKAPDYVILSHLWGKKSDELEYRDMDDISTAHVQAKLASTKVGGFCQLAKERHGVEYVWIDTCCIDKTNNVELGKAIMSMFEWYSRAKACYAYLDDVDKDSKEETLERSRWFTRGWTLQELLAPRDVLFFDRNWSLLGSKRGLAHEIQAVTRIPFLVLQGAAGIHEASVAQRMSWAADRVTTVPEDRAYCLVGLFRIGKSNLVFSPNYGERIETAFYRLQKAIMVEINDDSILSWGFGNDPAAKASSVPESTGLLASSPADFAKCENIVRVRRGGIRIRAADQSQGDLPVFLKLVQFGGVTYGLLDCAPDRNSREGKVVGVPLFLQDSSDLECKNYFRMANVPPTLYDPTAPEVENSRQIRISVHSRSDTKPLMNRQWCFFLGSGLPLGLEVIKVAPEHLWNKDMMVLGTRDLSGTVLPGPYILKLRSRHPQNAIDFFLVMHLDIDNGVPSRCRVGLTTASTELGIDTLEPYLAFLHLESQVATDGKMGLRADVKAVHVMEQEMLSVVFSWLNADQIPEALGTSVDVSEVVRDLGEMVNLVKLHDRKASAHEKTVASARDLKRRQPEHNRLRGEISAVERAIKDLEERLLLLNDRAAKEEQKIEESTETFRKATMERENCSTAIMQQEGIFLSTIPAEPHCRWEIAAKMVIQSKYPNSDEQGSRSEYPLHWFCGPHPIPELVHRLLLEGVDPNAVDTRGLTALTAALTGDNASLQVVQILLRDGNSEKGKDDHGRKIATDIVSVPVQVGTQTAEDLGVKAFTDVSKPCDTSPISAQIGRRKFADVNLPDGHGHFPLSYAAGRCSWDICKLLVDHGGKVRAGGSPVLAYTVSGLKKGYHDEEIALKKAKLFLRHGATIKTNDQDRAAELAVELGSVEFLRLFVEIGGSRSFTDKRGVDLLQLAIRHQDSNPTCENARAVVDYIRSITGGPLPRKSSPPDPPPTAKPPTLDGQIGTGGPDALEASLGKGESRDRGNRSSRVNRQGGFIERITSPIVARKN